MFLKNFTYGLIIGIGFITPGVSGGVLAAILGIYDEIINRLNNFFKNSQKNLLYFIPLILGFIISVLLFSKIILYLLNYKKIFISYLFIGLILGSIPFLKKEIIIKTNKNVSIISFIISIIIGIFLFLLKNNINYSEPTTIIMVLSGICYSIGKIIPGISGASLLILLGTYKMLLSIIVNPLSISLSTFILLIPFIISFIISSIIIIKIIDYLLINYFRITYSAIIGFVLTSTLFLYPNYFSLYYLLVAILSFIISYYLSN